MNILNMIMSSQSRRQIGSTFKPVVYTAAVEAGIDPCTYYSVT